MQLALLMQLLLLLLWLMRLVLVVQLVVVVREGKEYKAHVSNRSHLPQLHIPACAFRGGGGGGG